MSSPFKSDMANLLANTYLYIQQFQSNIIIIIIFLL